MNPSPQRTMGEKGLLLLVHIKNEQITYTLIDKINTPIVKNDTLIVFISE